MRRLLMIVALCVTATSVFAQTGRKKGIEGTFSGDIQIRSTTSTATTDTTMIDSVSFGYAMWPVMTLYYRFLDGGSVGTTMYFETRVQGGLNAAEFAIVDSLVISSVDQTNWGIWNVTDGPIGFAKRFRIRKSTAADTVELIFNGYNRDQQ